MNRIRIMHVVSGLGTGGTERGLRKLLTGLDPSLFEQLVCSIKGGFEAGEIDGGHVLTVGHRPGQRTFLMRRLAHIFRSERPDIVHSRNWASIEAVPAARWSSVPAIIHSEHGRDLQELKRTFWRRRLFRRFCYRIADQIFAVSDELRDYYLSQVGAVAERLRVIANGVDTARFCRIDTARYHLRAHLGIPEHAVVVGSLGRLDPIKDHRTLFRAAEQSINRGLDFRLIVVGEGPERERLQADVSASPSLRQRVMFIGETNEVAEWLNAFDLYVLSSLSEGMSNTLLEAMAVGIPVIATRVGGNPQVIANGDCGLLFPAGDADTLARDLCVLISSPERRIALGRSGRMRVEKCFSLKNMLQQYTQMYCEVLGRDTPVALPAGRRELQVLG